MLGEGNEFDWLKNIAAGRYGQFMEILKIFSLDLKLSVRIKNILLYFALLVYFKIKSFLNDMMYFENSRL